MTKDFDSQFTRKLKIDNPIVWDHHRSGWKYVMRILDQYLVCENGIKFISAIDDIIFEEQVIDEPWVGFFHQVPRTHYPYFPDLERALRSQSWHQSAPQCCGVFVLSDYLRQYLVAHNLSTPIEMVYYPMGDPGQPFSWAGFCHNPHQKVVFIGEYLRNFQAFYDLETDYQKVLLAPDNYNPQRYQINDSVLLQGRLSDAEYDHMLSHNIVFLNLFDAPANTTVIECISRNTPIIINRLPGVVEYLGVNYPLYYDTLEEASQILGDLDRIHSANTYLQKWHLKSQLTGLSFIHSFHNSSIYQNLPIPH